MTRLQLIVTEAYNTLVELKNAGLSYRQLKKEALELQITGHICSDKYPSLFYFGHYIILITPKREIKLLKDTQGGIYD